jgi:glyoxylase-like metal-dependent hydrolase (beta-lactamase superfamily II)
VFIHRIPSLIANMYLIENDAGLVIVDTGFSRADAEILQSIEQLGHTPGDVRLIFLTHVHLDHAGSAAALRRATGAPIALHQADLQKARAGWHNMPHGRGILGKMIERAMNGAGIKMIYEPFEPDVLTMDGQSLAEFGLPARVVHTPGHTLGSQSLFFDDGAMFIGDAMINQIRVGMPLYGEDNDLAYDSLRKINSFQSRILYSGHGKPFAGAEIPRYFETKGLPLATAVIHE